MSWHKITLPLVTHQIDPKVVEIGDLTKDIYGRENQPAGFAMIHATRGSEGELDDKFLVYLSPVAYELCAEVIGERYTLEPCDVPACDEPNAAFVFGDPHVMAQLKEKFEPEPGTVEWKRAEAARAELEAGKAAYEEEVARIQAEEAAQAEAAQADSAQA